MAQQDWSAKNAQVLRDAAQQYRDMAAQGTEPEVNALAAELLERRAARVASGEDDHSSVDVRVAVDAASRGDHSPPA